MGPVLQEIMEPELREAERKGREEGIQEGIQKGIHGTVEILQELGISGTEIRNAKRYKLTEQETAKFL